MRKVRTFILGVAASTMLAASPVSQAQGLAELELMQTFLEIMTDYFEIIESTHEISGDAEKAAIMQMMKIQEVYEAQGNKVGSVELLQTVISQTRNPAIRNAAYMMIGDTLKDAGRTDEALKTLREALDENIAAAQ